MEQNLEHLNLPLFPEITDHAWLRQQFQVHNTENIGFIPQLARYKVLRMGFISALNEKYESHLGHYDKSSEQIIALIQGLTEAQQAFYFYNCIFAQNFNYNSHDYYWYADSIYGESIERALTFFNLKDLLKIYKINQAKCLKYKHLASDFQDKTKRMPRKLWLKAGWHLSNSYYKKVDKFIRQNASLFCLDEDNQPFVYEQKGRYISLIIEDEGHYEIDFYHNEWQGESRFFQQNGILGHFETRHKINGKWHEHTKTYYESGLIMMEHNAIDGIEGGIVHHFYDTGVPHMTRENGKFLAFWKPDGTQTLKEGNGYYENDGQYHEYKDGILHGKFIEHFYGTEKLLAECRYEFGMIEGLDTRYYEDGNLCSQSFYEKNVPIWSINYPETPTLDGKWQQIVGSFEDEHAHRKVHCLNWDEVSNSLKKPTRIRVDGRETCISFHLDLVLDIDTDGQVTAVLPLPEFEKSFDYDYFNKNDLKLLKFKPRKIKGVLVPFKAYFGIGFDATSDALELE
jgi:antitoxin component YwqK of YwqJK toxin-antitoxin module